MAQRAAWTQDYSADPEWARLAREDEHARDRWIQDVLEGVAKRSERERRNDMRRILQTELELPDRDFVAMTAGRYRAWLRMNPAAAAAVISAAEAVQQFDVAGSDATRVRQAAAQAVRALTWRQLGQLAQAAPWLADIVQAERRRRPTPSLFTRLLAVLTPWVRD